MYAGVAFAIGLCDGGVFNPKAVAETVGHMHTSSLLAAERSAGWHLLGAGVVYMSSWNLVLGVPGPIGLCGFVTVVIGAVMVTGHRGSAASGSGAEGVAVSARQQEHHRVEESVVVDETEKTDARSIPWSAWLLRGYFTVVYFYAGTAKLEADWLRGWTLREVLRLWTGDWKESSDTAVSCCSG